MKIDASDIHEIDFVNGDNVHRCDKIWVGSLGEYTTTYDSLTEFLQDRQDNVGETFAAFKRKATDRMRSRL